MTKYKKLIAVIRKTREQLAVSQAETRLQIRLRNDVIRERDQFEDRLKRVVTGKFYDDNYCERPRITFAYTISEVVLRTCDDPQKLFDEALTQIQEEFRKARKLL